jgi:TatD DNase family protein
MAIVTADICRQALDPSVRYAVAIHPWEADPGALPLLHEMARRPNVAAIGETGLDKRKGPPLTVQEELFHAHIQLAEVLDKPLIIHCVGAWHTLLRIFKTSVCHVPRIIHGFRGNGILAGQLLDAGFYLSFGRHFRPEAVSGAWAAHKLFAETDEDDIGIREIYAALAASLSVAQEDLSQQIAVNFKAIKII